MSDDKVNVGEIKNKTLISQKAWSIKVSECSYRLKEDLKGVSDLQADIISQRQLAIDEVSIYSLKIYKQKQLQKKLEKSRFEFYATSYQVKTSGTEKLRLIQSDLADIQYIMDIYETHINHLREAAKNLESLNYACKSKIELYNILGGHERL